MTQQTMDKDQARATKRLPQNFVDAARDFERFTVDEVKKSRRLAWIVASVATALTCVAVVGFLVALLMRTEPEPVVLRVNEATGNTTMLRSLRDANDHYGEVVDKYWLAQYVRTCEGYDWYLISESLEACNLMSEGPVAKEHEAKVRAPTAPLANLKDRGKVAVQIGSIAFLGDTAQVRFTTEKLTNSGENSDGSPTQRWIATVYYAYDPTEQMTEQQRLVDPLGFKVSAYRVDPEVLR